MLTKRSEAYPGLANHVPHRHDWIHGRSISQHHRLSRRASYGHAIVTCLPPPVALINATGA